ncbi:hypothetical protein GS421_11250 [Rhodococcus hoagii]|nr:hypothetical protein [Prescottella equi]
MGPNGDADRGSGALSVRGARGGGNPSLGNWLTVALAVIVVVGSTVSALSAWRNRNTVRVPAKVSPAEVALADVSAAIASSSGRIDAIRRLRQMYPGLGLLDAKELVDRQLPGPG